MLKFYAKILSIIFLIVLASINFALASSTNGTIDSSNKYAWSENAGWIDFSLSQGNVRITDSALTGYAYGENIGWISLNCANGANTCATADFKVANDGSGNLTGYAWSENTGWINFAPSTGGVIINSSGEFTGSAYGENIGWVTFNCLTTASCATADYKVATDWRPRSARPQCNNALDDDSDGKIDYSADPGCSSLEDNSEVDNTGAVIPFFSNAVAVAGQTNLPAPVEKIQETTADLSKKLEEIKDKTVETLKPIIEQVIRSPLAPFIKGGANAREAKKIALEKKLKEEVRRAVPIDAPEALKGRWPLLPEGPIKNFSLSPLTQELSLLLNKFPELENTFVNLGVNKIDDLEKLDGVKLFLPGLTRALGLTGGAAADGGIRLSGGIPLNDLPAAAKEKIPAEVVFAKSTGQLIDFNMELTVSKTGETESKLNVISGRSLSLLIRPENLAKSVKGSIIFKDKTAELKLDKTLTGTLKDLAIKTALAETETRLVLNEFNYNDDDGDGVWTAEVQAPLVTGKYEIITKIDYQDEKLAAKEIRLITVIDPEGYVYKQDGRNETRLAGAVISLFWLNPLNNNFELWPAATYQQANPQTTDLTGRYSFLVPSGEYYLKVELAGYGLYQGQHFTVKEGGGVHTNIELKPKFWNFKMFDWKTVFLIILAALILYNFYRDRKLSKL